MRYLKIIKEFVERNYKRVVITLSSIAMLMFSAFVYLLLIDLGYIDLTYKTAQIVPYFRQAYIEKITTDNPHIDNIYLTHDMSYAIWKVAPYFARNFNIHTPSNDLNDTIGSCYSKYDEQNNSTEISVFVSDISFNELNEKQFSAFIIHELYHAADFRAGLKLKDSLYDFMAISQPAAYYIMEIRASDMEIKFLKYLLATGKATKEEIPCWYIEDKKEQFRFFYRNLSELKKDTLDQNATRAADDHLEHYKNLFFTSYAAAECPPEN